jgi:outer membrane protein assembly factor BamB
MTRRITTILALFLPLSALAADWPSYQHDNLRSGITAEQLAAAALTQSWVFTAKTPPQSAWHGKMKRDSYAKRTFQADSFDYDKVFNLVAADGRVFFGSSSGNACVALNAADGAELWRMPVGGAVRCAPAYDGGKVYFGSDDGQAYCVNAADGSFVWSYRGGPSATLIASDHKFVSRYACRTGVLVQGGKAWCGFGLLTWHGNYMAKLDAATGAEEKNTYKKGTTYSFEGTLLADAANIYVTQGKNSPASFRLSDASPFGTFPGCGGTFATLSADGHLFHGPGHRGKRVDFMQESNASTRADVATHEFLSRIIVNGADRFGIYRDSVKATGAHAWTQGVERPVTLVLGGTTLYVGAHDKVIAYDTATGNVLSILPVDGDAYCLAIVDGKLFVSTHTGKIYCFS